MADIDHFKSVNDTYGHQVGDAVLQQFASVVTQNIKGQDMVARYGGEEFAIILPETDLFSAYNLLVKIKYTFKNTETPVEGTLKSIKDVTASFGLVRPRARSLQVELTAAGQAMKKQCDRHAAPVLETVAAQLPAHYWDSLKTLTADIADQFVTVLDKDGQEPVGGPSGR